MQDSGLRQLEDHGVQELEFALAGPYDCAEILRSAVWGLKDVVAYLLADGYYLFLFLLGVLRRGDVECPGE